MHVWSKIIFLNYKQNSTLFFIVSIQFVCRINQMEIGGN